MPDDYGHSLQRTVRVVSGVKGKLGSHKKWAWAVDYSYDRNGSYSHYSQNTSFLNQAYSLGVYTPFRDLSRFPNTAPLSELQTIRVTRNKPEIYVANARLSGELYQWSGGPITTSLGVERRDEQIRSSLLTDYANVLRLNSPALIPILNQRANGEINAKRRANALYAELSLPLVGSGNQLPLVDALDLQLAARHEAYGSYAFRSTFGAGVSNTAEVSDIDDTPVTAGLRYQPVPGLVLRASYSGAFASPTMSNLFSARITSPNPFPVTFFDPLADTLVTRPEGSVVVTSGGNPDLQPESGSSYNYGVIVSPESIPGLRLAIDYFRVRGKDQISSPGVQTIVRYFPERVQRDAAGNVIAYDTSAINMSEVVVGGVDAAASYTLDAKARGTFTLSTNVTYTDLYKVKAITGDPFVEGVGDQTLGNGAPIRVKGQASLFWEKAAYTFGLTGRYIGKYKDAYNNGTQFSDASVAEPDGDFIPPQFEMDLQMSYRFSENGVGWRSYLSGVHASVGVRNLFDREPPYTSANFGYYSFYNDPRQRFVSLELKRSF